MLWCQIDRKVKTNLKPQLGWKVKLVTMIGWHQEQQIHLHNFVLGKRRKLARYVINWTHLMLRKKRKRVQNGGNWHKSKDWIVFIKERKISFSTHHFLKTWNSDLKNWFKQNTTKGCDFSHTKRQTLWHMWDQLCDFIHYNVQYVMFIVTHIIQSHWSSKWWQQNWYL